MNNKRPILSISILISGREEMRKCLESLKPFLTELSCELILVDTGCNEAQLSIAREYTDIIIPFTWCNDFAAARNVGLNRAKGEWFLFLDDDEWFEDPSEIISFFKTGEHRKYNGGYYKVHNHVDYSGENYAEHFVTRIIRKRKETCFKGKVHEALYPLYLPLKTFHAHVEHYGYVYTSEEEKGRHALRNIPLLLEQIEEEPDALRWYGQLAQEYLVVSENKKGVEIALEGINRYETRKKSREASYRIYAALFCYAAIFYINMFDMKSAEEIFEKGLEKIKGEKPGRAYMLQSAATVFEKSGRYLDCVNVAKEYFDIYDKIGMNEEIISSEGFLITQGAFDEVTRATTLICASLAAAKEREYEKLEYFFFKMDWQDPRMLKQQELEKCVIEAILDAPCRESFFRMMKSMGERNGGMAELYPILLEIEKECKKNSANEKLERLWNLVAEIEAEHFYILMSKIYCMDKQGDRDGIKEIFCKIFEKEDYVLDMKEDVWELAEKNRISLEPLFLNMNLAKWKRMLEKWVYIAPYEEAEAWERRCEKWNCKDDLRYLLLKIRCKEIILRQKGLKENVEILENLLDEYVEEALSYYRIFYKEEIFTDRPEALPDEARLSLKYLHLKEEQKSMDAHRVIRALQEIVDTYPVLEEVMLHYVKMIRDEISKRDKEADAAKRELEVLVASLKTTAKLRMERGEYQVAKEILLQIQNCMPGDEEVGGLLEKIENS